MVKRNEYSYYRTATLDSLKFSSSSVRDNPSHLTMKKISVTVRDNPSHLTMKKISVTVRDTPSHLTMKKISFSRHSTQSIASICCTPIRSPAIVIQTSGASRDVVYVVFLDSLHTHFSLHDPDYSGLYVQSNIVLRLSSRISLGCSADYSTVASMVIAHKVGRYAGKASLYAWNSSILEDFSSVSVDLRFSYVIALDLMTAFEMDLYSSFAGFVELSAPPGEVIVDDNLLSEHPWSKLMIESVFLYGSLPRPPDLQSPMVCVWIMHSISHQLSSGTVYCCVPHEPCIDSEDSFRHPNLSRQGEIWLDNLMQNHQLVIAPRCLELSGVGMICEIVPALCCVDEFIHLVSMVHEAVPKMLLVSQGLRVIDTYGYGLYATDAAIQILELIAEELLFCPTCVLLGQTFARCSKVHSYPLGYTPKQGEFLPSYPICKLLKSSTKDTKLRMFTLKNLVFLVLLQQSFRPVSLQRQSQDYDLIRQIIVAHFGWFGSILEFLYGSLPRPPDVLYVFSPKPTILMVVQVQDASPFHLEGEY